MLSANSKSQISNDFLSHLFCCWGGGGVGVAHLTFSATLVSKLDPKPTFKNDLEIVENYHLTWDK